MSGYNGHNETRCQNKFWKSTNITIIIIRKPFCARTCVGVRSLANRRGWSVAGLIRDCCGCGHDGRRYGGRRCGPDGNQGEGRCVMFPVQFLMEQQRRLLPACVHRRQFTRSSRVVCSSTRCIRVDVVVRSSRVHFFPIRCTPYPPEPPRPWFYYCCNKNIISWYLNFRYTYAFAVKID